MYTIASVLLVNYMYRHEIDNGLDYLNNKEALLCTLALSLVFEVTGRYILRKKQ